MSVLTVLTPPEFQQPAYAPDVDYSGTSTANQVNQTFIVSSNSADKLQLLMMQNGPFYADSFTATYDDGASVRPLVAGVDFVFAFPFIGASRSTKIAVYGGIVILNNDLAGSFKTIYQTVGGAWLIGADISSSLMYELNKNPYITSLEQVVNYPSSFPVVTTPWDKTDPTSMKDVTESVLSFTNTLADVTIGSIAGMASAKIHPYDYTNPHGDTKAMIGLGLVSNLPAATNPQAEDTTFDGGYITPAQLKFSFLAALPDAKTTSRGVAKLNSGTEADALDGTKPLTAYSFSSLAQTPNTPFFRAIYRGQFPAALSPFPADFPLKWNGNTYTSLAALISGIEIACGAFPLEYNAATGVIWFPANATIPNLTVTPA